MAADSRAYTGNKVPIGHKEKIVNINGVLVGASSTRPGTVERALKWFREGMKTPVPDADFALLAVYPNGEAIYATGDCNPSGPLRADYFAIGSGEEYALGAMAAGCTAEEAVRIACWLDVWSEEPVVTLRHEDVSEMVA